jgi:2-hydroxycyclohexanecarboxyl-CoA dehydrogenase
VGGFDLSGKVAFVNGGAGGIGRCTSEALAELGAAVVVADINGELAHSTAETINQRGGRAIALEGDGADRATVDSMVAQAREQLGPISIAVNIVGRSNPPGRPINLWEQNDDDWDWIMRVNFKSAIYLTRAVVEDMKAASYGKIVFLAADHGRTGGQIGHNPTVYASSKGALITLTKSVARDLGKHNISVNAVAPGLTAQPDREQGLTAAAEIDNRLKFMVPLGRRALPTEQADAIAFFCSPASDFITGQVLSVNGGMDMVD